MKKKNLPLLLIMPLVLGGCSIDFNSLPGGKTSLESSPDITSSSLASSSSESTLPIKTVGRRVKDDVNVKIAHYIGDGPTIDETVFYDDDWFLGDPKEVNHGLALMSVITGGASTITEDDAIGNKIAALMDVTGFANIERNVYYAQDINLDDSIGAVIGEKTLIDKDGKPYTLLALFPRSGGYRNEWAGNFNMAISGMHAGFRLCRDELLRFMKNYISAYEISGDLKLWIAGYSRGAATANLVAGYLEDNPAYLGRGVSLAPKDIFAYTFATPSPTMDGLAKSDVLNVSGSRGLGFYDTDVPAYVYGGEDAVIHPSAEAYQGIHNFIAIGDFVPKLPPETWGFTRYGVTEKILFGSDEMIENVKKYSPEIADILKQRNYLTETPVKSLDRETLSLVDTDEKQTVDGELNERVEALMGYVKSRKDMVESGCASLVGGLITSVMADSGSFLNALKSNVMGLVKVALTNYLVHVKEATGLEESKAVATMLAQFMGKKDASLDEYTDQQFLRDLFDYLINDYQTKPEGATRAQVLAKLIPAPYGEFYLGLLESAKEEKLTVRVVDDLVYLFCKYVSDHRDAPAAVALVEMVVKAVPDDYASLFNMLVGLTGKTYEESEYPDKVSMQKAIVFDSFHALAYDRYEGEEIVQKAATVRYGLVGLLAAFVLKDAPRLQNLLVNGAHYTETDVLESDPAPLYETVEEILNIQMPKDEEGNRLSMEDAADESIIDFLESVENDANAPYILALQEHPKMIRDVLFALLFEKREGYDLFAEVDDVVNLIDMVTLIARAHAHELYISFMKTRVTSEKE